MRTPLRLCICTKVSSAVPSAAKVEAYGFSSEEAPTFLSPTPAGAAWERGMTGRAAPAGDTASASDRDSNGPT